MNLFPIHWVESFTGSKRFTTPSLRNGIYVEAFVASVSSSLVFFGNYIYIYIYKYKSSILKCHFKYISEKYIKK